MSSIQLNFASNQRLMNDLTGINVYIVTSLGNVFKPARRNMRQWRAYDSSEWDI